MILLSLKSLILIILWMKNDLGGIGCIRGIVIITTCFMERGKRIRIINARKATSNEEKIYHERYKEYYR